MDDLVPLRRALISVSDKTGLVDLARALVARGVEIISTGGTAKALERAALPVTPVERVTGFPEIMDGRVKTLHPAVHGGLLARREVDEHRRALEAHAIAPIDLVVVNLYPFERASVTPGFSHEDVIEQIDIGGPSMIRSGAKNARWCVVLTHSDQYPRLLDELDRHAGATGEYFRARLAAEAFARTAAYDAAIAAFLGAEAPPAPGGIIDASRDLPDVLPLRLTRAMSLRYGENPHQRAAAYLRAGDDGPSVLRARQLHGKELSYNNLADAGAALELARALDASGPAAVVVKHTNPCGAGVAPTLERALDGALAGDPLAAYGGILACSRPFTLGAAERLADPALFFEVIAAPAFEPGAADLLKARWRLVRLLEIGPLDPTRPGSVEFRSIPGGVLVQERDLSPSRPETWTHAAGPAPDRRDLEAAGVMEQVVRALTSNAVCIGGRDGEAIRLFGAGAGQMDRVASCRLAITKAGDRARGGVAASDAFFPFPDGPSLLIEAGVRLIVHPGGSRRDQETLDVCARAGVTCMLTGMRRFRH
ncbi:MAG: bifunctional phosphoribosylaminoimidazolecarboxamide formyltransferase/IMP cyclohydrolase [Phycisphaerales bacterium]|nr:bifunctional phosphoribosylaminoimidazolecarboxamide formyltransferase/IMP cyclohydrolase [Phycisphaerales bacterium]